MNRIKNLNYYQKGILLVMLAMAIIFAVIYPKTISRVGYEYENAILVPREENGTTVYSGKIKGKVTEFTVDKDNSTVAFRYGDKNYGQYIVKSNPAAVPKDPDIPRCPAGYGSCARKPCYRPPAPDPTQRRYQR